MIRTTLRFALTFYFIFTVPSISDVLGTGFFYNDRGDIMTNKHVIENCNTVYAKLPNGNTTKLELIAISENYDLAALSSNHSTERFLALRTTKENFPLIPVDNEELFTLGYSYFSESGGEKHGVAGRAISLADDWRKPAFALRIDVTQGASGSPVVGRDLLLVGVITEGTYFDDLPDEMAGYYGDGIIFALNGNAIADFVNNSGIYISTWTPDHRALPHEAWGHLLQTTSLIICDE